MYHNTVRRVKLDEQVITQKRFAEAVLCSGIWNFWSEVEKIIRNRDAHAKVIDNCCNPHMASIFARKYTFLYSSLLFSACDMDAVKCEI
jgi:hypothetical protein